jgi:hypothetical protein
MVGSETIARKESSCAVTLGDIRYADSALCLIDLHAFLVKSDLHRALHHLKGIVSSECQTWPCTSQVLKAEMHTFAYVAKNRHRHVQAIHTPNGLVAVIREHLQHYKEKSIQSGTHKLKYHSVRDQAHVFANAFSKTFPQLWHNSEVSGLLATSLQDFPLGLDLHSSENPAPQDIKRMQKNIEGITNKRCRVSDPKKLHDLLHALQQQACMQGSTPAVSSVAMYF